jgi:serine phosphatase RsbU (regulator of sigma subunit)
MVPTGRRGVTVCDAAAPRGGPDCAPAPLTREHVDISVAHLLRELDSQPPFALVDVTTAHLCDRVGALAVSLWLNDYEQSTLLRWTPPGTDPGDQRDIEDGPLGTCYVHQRPTAVEHPQGSCVYVPITIRAERLGALEILLAQEPDTETINLLRGTATLLAYVLLGARRYTDVFERVRRRKELEVPAELQWELLPVLAHDGPDFTIAGALEPAYDIGGDNFDYSVAPSGLSVSITDAMGHGVAAALLCGLNVAVQRNARRRGLSVRQQMRAANIAVNEQYGGEAFLTTLALRIDRTDGSAQVVNAGHSYAFLMRGTVIDPLPLEADVPVGLFRDTEYTAQDLRLAPGDRLLLFTDGIVEAESPTGEPFGEGRIEETLLATSAEHPSEVVRKLTRDVMAYRGEPLIDDATAVCVDYRRST